MKIFLDSKDLIDILQRGKPCKADELKESLRRGDHQLVLSFETVCEISAPLAKPAPKTNVMALLNHLDEMPITFIHPAIEYLELKEALGAFIASCECKALLPFVACFDQSIDPHARVSTYSLAETVWDRHSRGGLKGMDCFAPKMREIFAADRSQENMPSLKAHFASVIERDLRLSEISCSGVSLQDFSNWIYENPNRCPSIRLGYELWQQIRKNKTDTLQDSDMEDYQHIICLPYVGLMTLDKRMHHYVSQATASMGLDYSGRVFKGVQDVLCRL